MKAKFNQFMIITGHPKKSVSRTFFCLTLLLFYSDMVHKKWLKVWFLTSQMPVLSGRLNFVPFPTTFQKLPWNTAKMVKNLQCLKTLQMCYLGQPEHHAKNRTSLRGLDHKTLFFWWPVINCASFKLIDFVMTWFLHYTVRKTQNK